MYFVWTRGVLGSIRAPCIVPLTVGLLGYLRLDWTEQASDCSPTPIGKLLSSAEHIDTPRLARLHSKNRLPPRCVTMNPQNLAREESKTQNRRHAPPFVSILLHLPCFSSSYQTTFYPIRHASFRTPHPTCGIGIHVFLGRSHKNRNTVFRLVNPELDRSTYICKVNVFIKQAKCE